MSSMVLNKAVVRSSLTAATTPPSPNNSIDIAVLPNRVIHKIVSIVGAPSTPNKNSLMVRPREIRAIKMPVNGDQAIHQPQ